MVLQILTQYGKTVWNSGSVGCPLNGKSKAEFMILHSKDKQWEVEFVILDYDVEAVIKEMREKSFYETAPFWTQVSEQLLRGGTVAHGTALNRAMELCQIKYGECRWPGYRKNVGNRHVRNYCITGNHNKYRKRGTLSKMSLFSYSFLILIQVKVPF